jgi:phosphohistidine phosphatase SixA
MMLKKAGFIAVFVMLVAFAGVVAWSKNSLKVHSPAMQHDTKMDGEMHAQMAPGHHMHQHAQPDEAKLIEELKKGGYILFVRHERTELTRTHDVEPTDYKDCSMQRNLSESGIASAKELAVAIKIIGIPVAESYTSPFCRNVQTAEYAFGKSMVVQKLSGRAANTDSFDVEKAGAYLKEFLATLTPAQGQNIAVVGHWGNFSAAFGKHIHEGDMAVMKKDGTQFVYLGAIHPGTWSDVIHDAERAKMSMPQ